MNGLSDELMAELVDDLLGTPDLIEYALEKMGLDPDEYMDQVEYDLPDWGIERCPECGWWVEASELTDFDLNECPCDGCK